MKDEIVKLTIHNSSLILHPFKGSFHACEE